MKTIVYTLLLFSCITSCDFNNMKKDKILLDRLTVIESELIELKKKNSSYESLFNVLLQHDTLTLDIIYIHLSQHH